MATTSWLDSVAETLIPTSLGLINLRESGSADGPGMVCWPSLMMDGPCGGTSTSTSPRLTT